MKKLMILIVFLVLISCKKESAHNPTGIGNVCAECTEYHSGYVAVPFCGTRQEVDLYVKELKKQGSSIGQSWSCVIK
jgi:hypothetical protein